MFLKKKKTIKGLVALSPASGGPTNLAQATLVAHLARLPLTRRLFGLHCAMHEPDWVVVRVAQQSIEPNNLLPLARAASPSP